MLGILVILFALLVLLVPLPMHGGLHASRRAQAKNDVTQIANAVTSFHTEYGLLPGTSAGPVGGELLLALVGSNKTLNPRGIIFMEIFDAKKGKSGLSSGTFVDPWGGPYQIAFDADYDGKVTGGTNKEVVARHVAVWNDPRLQNLKPSWFSTDKPKSSDVTSWDRRNP